MKLHISAQTPYREISRFFHEQFPYLQIRFFTSGHAPGEGSARAGMINQPESPCNASGNAAFEVNAEQTAGELESWFENELGLHIQVFRKSGSVWLETTGNSDDLTLGQLNAKGREHQIDPKTTPETPDYHEQE